MDVAILPADKENSIDYCEDTCVPREHPACHPVG